jgi:hypothetical protein
MMTANSIRETRSVAPSNNVSLPPEDEASKAKPIFVVEGEASATAPCEGAMPRVGTLVVAGDRASLPKRMKIFAIILICSISFGSH